MKTNEEILIERAHLIAGNDNQVNSLNRNEVSLVKFLLTPELYAIENRFVSEVLLLKELTPIPGVPSYIAGVTNIRGRTLSVVNLKVFLGISTRGITELNRIIVISDKNMEFGILTDSVLGIFNKDLSELAPGPLTIHGSSQEFLKGITPEGIIVLDCHKLLSSSTIKINHKQK